MLSPHAHWHARGRHYKPSRMPQSLYDPMHPLPSSLARQHEIHFSLCFCSNEAQFILRGNLSLYFISKLNQENHGILIPNNSDFSRKDSQLTPKISTFNLSFHPNILDTSPYDLTKTNSIKAMFLINDKIKRKSLLLWHKFTTPRYVSSA